MATNKTTLALAQKQALLSALENIFEHIDTTEEWKRNEAKTLRADMDEYIAAQEEGTVIDNLYRVKCYKKDIATCESFADALDTIRATLSKLI